MRDLGVMIDSSLKFSIHCAYISKKAMRIVNILFRVLRGRGSDTFVRAYVSYIRPVLEYASPVWSPRLIGDVNVVEQVQRSFTKKLFYRCFPSEVQNSNYETRLLRLRLETLELRRVKADLSLLYSIIHAEDSSQFALFFEQTPPPFLTRGNSKRVRIQNFTPASDTARGHFVWRSSQLWNSLPEEVVSAPSKIAFRKRLTLVDNTALLPFSKIR